MSRDGLTLAVSVAAVTGGEAGGVYQSTDGGLNWQQVRDAGVWRAAALSGDGRTLVAGTAKQEKGAKKAEKAEKAYQNCIVHPTKYAYLSRYQIAMAQLERGDVRWLATAAMREELARVLTYPHIARRLQARGLQADAVLGAFDRHAQMQPDAPKAPYTCKDADDQKFIDLAVQHGAALHSKDAQVLCMKNRLARCGVALNPSLLETLT